MLAEFSGAGEAFGDNGAFESGADELGFAGVLGIAFFAAEYIVEEADRVADVVVDMFAGDFAAIEEVDDLEFEGGAFAADEDVVGVEVAVVFAGVVDHFESGGELAQEDERFEEGEAFAGLTLDEAGEGFAFVEAGNKEVDLVAADIAAVVGVVTDDEGAEGELLGFLRVTSQRLVVDVALGIKELGRATDAGGAFEDSVHLAFPAVAQEAVDHVFVAQLFAGLKIESSHGAVG